jgi:branched-subunit amino acid transport protein
MDSQFWIIFIGCVGVTYGSRLIGLYLPSDRLSVRQQAILGYVPIGAFTAIVFQGLTDANGELNARIPAIVVAAVMARYRLPLWACLAAGFGLYLTINRFG